MNDDPYGTMTPAAPFSRFQPPLRCFSPFFLLGILCAMCESAVGMASESRVKRDAESGSRRAKKFLAYLDANESFASPPQFGMMLMGFFSIGVSVIGFAPVLDNALIAAGLYPALAAPAAVVLCTLPCAALFLLLRRISRRKNSWRTNPRATRATATSSSADPRAPVP